MLHNIKADEIILGKNVIISPKAIIRGVDGNAKKIIIGDNTYIGDNVQIILDEFEIGDYCKIHHHTNLHGYKPMKIGHNAWVGQYTIIDSIGGVSIGDNCGVGAHSQLWSHIKYGDPLQGCNYNMSSPLIVEDDVWFVGHCIVSPIIAHDRSMAMVGSVVTKDMEFNQIYAGSPAKSISDKVGFQFEPVPVEVKKQKMEQYLQEWNPEITSLKIVTSREEMILEDVDFTYFNVADRTYTKRGTDKEVSFMKFLLPARAKFVPLM